jgi:hypothetical protein
LRPIIVVIAVAAQNSKLNKQRFLFEAPKLRLIDGFTDILALPIKGTPSRQCQQYGNQSHAAPANNQQQSGVMI